MFETDIAKERLAEYYKYHFNSRFIGDIDPSYPALKYLADRFELNVEQRFRLAFLYSTCYCVPTVYYIYSEFPDYKYVDVDRMKARRDKNKGKCMFQTDRRWIKSNNQFVDVFESYKAIIGKWTQLEKYEYLKGKTKQETYDNAFRLFLNMKNTGRYSMFLYLEAVESMTGFGLYPTKLDLKEADSSCNWLAYALWRDDLVIGRHDKKRLTDEQYKYLQSNFSRILREIDKQYPQTNSTIRSVETTLCAYKKYKRGKRYIGFYLDRQADEITKMSELVKEWVDWSVLRDFRQETYNILHLKELKWSIS